jgi:hypothetical protein
MFVVLIDDTVRGFAQTHKDAHMMAVQFMSDRMVAKVGTERASHMYVAPEGDGIFVREEGTRMQLVARSAVHEIVPAGWFSTASQRVRHQDTVLQTVAICAFDATSLLPGSWQVTRPTAAEPLARAAVSVAGWRGNRRAPVPYLPELMAALAQRGRRE